LVAKKRIMAGNWGKILYVDLTKDDIYSVPWGADSQRRFVGGSGLGTSILFEELSEKVKPLDPGNLLILATGPLQGTLFPGSAKWVAVSKSPLTKTICVSAAGANFGPALKRTGYDAIVLRGRCERPSYLLVTDTTVQILSAEALWGKDALESYEELRTTHQRLHPSILTIGQAGERLVAIACLVIDGHSFAGRGGLGAVMGAKRLKAVVVAGEQHPKIANKSVLQEITKKSSRTLYEATKETLRKHGTANGVVGSERRGDFPLRYWRQDSWPNGAQRIGAPRFTGYLSAKPNPCFACPVGCHRHIDFTTKDGIHIHGAGPEYETLGLLGGACLVDDLDTIAVANDRCNRLGIDTISAGSYVAFTMMCAERGLIKPGDVRGLSLAWGDRQTLLELVNQIGMREGFGALFADGIREAAIRIGGEAPKLTVEVKGLDIPAHDPRTYFSLAINYATSTKGASHLRGFPHVGEEGMLIPELGYTRITERFSMEGKAALTKLFQDYATLLDSLVLCCFMPISGLSLTTIVEALNAVTGWEMTATTAIQVGERVFNLQRLINVRDGFTKLDDRLPRVMFEEAKEGPRKGKVPEPFHTALHEYYALRGWSNDGVPKENLLAQLKLPKRGITRDEKYHLHI